ncbi:hypothetical protein NX779_01145 [Mycoplasma cottewii]|uniref:DUF4064 domain-containing protein n=1 Tax=Mycoplasma cottewii TaxID=51364 RepID=A0ABY5TYF8_9MOLU|nr:hypothetical protein [Mycoplasma cottewii]UWD35230.1 hypothetical protein NX779_01145 [Mycoplasma cottewii]
MNEQMTNEQMTNEQMMFEQFKSKKPKKISDLYKTGVMLSLILGCFGSLGGIIYIITTIPILLDLATTPDIDPALTSAKIFPVVIIAFFSVAFIPYIILVALGLKSLKQKTYKYRVIMSVLSIMFGLLLGIIAGVLMLVAERDNN